LSSDMIHTGQDGILNESASTEIPIVTNFFSFSPDMMQ
jgi:hypothetical protein